MFSDLGGDLVRDAVDPLGRFHAQAVGEKLYEVEK